MKKAIYYFLLAISTFSFITDIVLSVKQMPTPYLMVIGFVALFSAIIFRKVAGFEAKAYIRFSPKGTPPGRNRVKAVLLFTFIFCSIPAVVIGIAHAWDSPSQQVALPLLSISAFSIITLVLMNIRDKKKYSNNQ